MDSEYQATTAPAKARSLRAILIFVLIGVMVGVALAGWGLSKSQSVRDYLFGSESAPDLPVVSGATEPIVPPSAGIAALPPPPDVAPDVDADRLAALEARVAILGQNAAQSNNSDRAEGLLLAFAARRALDRGLALGYVEGRLNAHFGERQPRAVAMIIAAARQPATLDQLQTELESLTPKLAGNGPDESWWGSIQRSLSSLIIVREAGAPSPAPAERLIRATSAIRSGRVDQALAEVARLPNRDAASDWMIKARRYIEAYRALDLIEAAAIMGPEEVAPPPVIALPNTDDRRESEAPPAKSGPMF
jgi:hypothetical protein